MIALLTFVSALGCGIAAGVFFAFSSFVMPALARLPPGQGVAAMNSINVAAINRWFMGVLLGTAAACLALTLASLRTRVGPGTWLRLAGSVLFLVGAIAVTRIFNVPRNVALAGVLPDGPDAAEQWLRYVTEWTAWNHVRAGTSLLAAALMTLSLLQRAAAGAPLKW